MAKKSAEVLWQDERVEYRAYLLPNHAVRKGALTIFCSRDEFAKMPLRSAIANALYPDMRRLPELLFEIPGIQEIGFAPGKVMVVKDSLAEWGAIHLRIMILMRHLRRPKKNAQSEIRSTSSRAARSIGGTDCAGATGGLGLLDLLGGG